MQASLTTTLRDTLHVILIGNPNTGKTTLFNALTGLQHRVGNYPGVTVETKTATVKHWERRISITDVPGTYSLSPRSLDEMLAVDLLLGQRKEIGRPDVVVCIVDASNIERNLYLTTQIFELGVPVVVALNMVDVARSHEIQIDVEKLAASLGVQVIPLQANANKGLKELITAIERAAAEGTTPKTIEFPQVFRVAVERLQNTLGTDGKEPRYLFERALLDRGGSAEARLAKQHGEKVVETLTKMREELASQGCAVPAIEARTRYAWINTHVRPAVTRPQRRKETSTDRIDRVLLHPVFGLLVFLLLMLVMFQSIYTLASFAMDSIDLTFGLLSEWVSTQMPEGPLQSLVKEGVIAGVGGVLVFLPQIMILFAFIALLEDCGYMARAAFLMDRLMAGCGLSGKSFVPLLSSFACAIPGIMATRTIEDRRDRIATILIAPLMSCAARLPVYSVLIAAFIPEQTLISLGGITLLSLQGVTLFSMYLIGLVAAPFVAWTLKKTLLRGGRPVFLMELPSYKWPSLKTVIWRMLERGWAFVKRAGTLILATTIVIWALQYYPRPHAIAEPFELERTQANLVATDDPAKLEETLKEIDNREASAYQQQSILGQIGHAIEPIVKPLGWDWRIGMAAIASFPAREVVVGALGTIYSVGSDIEPDNPGLHSAMRRATWPDGRPVFNVPVALSIMVFFALCCQCAATLAVIQRELNSWAWPLFTFFYMTTLAYLAALVVYQVGIRL